MRRVYVGLAMGALLAVSGCSGDDGARGPAGKAGPAGEAGPPGTGNGDGGPGPKGDDGLPGEAGPPGDPGEAGPPGTNGDAGPPGENGLSILVAERHGTAALAKMELTEHAKFIAKTTITSATADAAGKVTVSFKVEDPAGNAVVGLTGVSANIAKLQAKQTGESWNSWVPYIYKAQTVSGNGFPKPAGTKADQGWRENDGTLTDNKDGTYSYVFKTNIAAVTTPVGQKAISYDQAATTRVAIMFGGETGPTGDAFYDFVPSGGTVSQTRDIIQTSTCKNCHGDGFHGHEGDRRSLEVCVTCHNPSSTDAYTGNSLDAKQMIHKIHAGGELPTVPGTDGILWNNPTTPVDESADNVPYYLYDAKEQPRTWWKAEFPAVLSNCTKCHEGAGKDVDNWKNVPSRQACASCHDDVDFTNGTNHTTAGAQANDDGCKTCHGATTGLKNITTVHDWTTKDQRNIPEFDATVTVSTPANGKFFVKGESPVVTVVLKDKESSATFDHTTVVQDTCTGSGCVAAEGCTAGACPAKDGKFTNAGLFVHGPRGRRVPVLTTGARAKIVGSSVGPFDISAAGASLDLKVDGGKNILSPTSQNPILGTFSVKVPAAGAACGTKTPCFASLAAATPQEIVDWLNADTNFKARALAYLDEATGRPAIRSRKLGITFESSLTGTFSVQLTASVVATQVFGGDLTVKTMTGSTVSNQLYQCVAASCVSDPKVVRTADKITYTLDPVDDLVPGTYIASVEITDRGRIDANNYKTPSVAKTPFLVGTDTEEKLVADNCNTCHQSADGKGFILDFSRHNKIFSNNALDQCGACHDYQPQNAAGQWSGAVPIARRVHAVHAGSTLVYPLVTVSYANGDPVPGRNWDITFPQDLRTCDKTCHTDKSSGTWATKPARLPCMGCHDTDANSAHFKIMTYDPTPLDPWSGDEEESCATCHAP